MAIIDNDVLPRYNFLIIAIIFLNTSSQRIGTKKREAYNLMFVFFFFCFLYSSISRSSLYISRIIYMSTRVRAYRSSCTCTYTQRYIYIHTYTDRHEHTHAFRNQRSRNSSSSFLVLSLSFSLPLYFSFSPNFLLAKTVVLIHSSVKTTAVY